MLQNERGVNQVRIIGRETLQIIRFAKFALGRKLAGLLQHASRDINTKTLGEIIMQAACQPSYPASKINGSAALSWQSQRAGGLHEA